MIQCKKNNRFFLQKKIIPQGFGLTLSAAWHTWHKIPPVVSESQKNQHWRTLRISKFRVSQKETPPMSAHVTVMILMSLSCHCHVTQENSLENARVEHTSYINIYIYRERERDYIKSYQIVKQLRDGPFFQVNQKNLKG